MTGRIEPPPVAAHADEVAAGDRFAFGANWARFLGHLDTTRIAAAERSLLDMLALPSVGGLRFLDAGSGSGLFSLAAWRLGATVHAFDFDPQSVACTAALRRLYGAADASRWQVESGSVLDRGYLAGLGSFDIVYSWGVLHHTGDQWAAFDAVCRRVRMNGRLFVALYNDQGAISVWWTWVKRLYNRNAVARVMLIAAYTPYFVWLRWLYRRLTRRGPVGRGMTLWYDMLDWLGGYPFQVSRPDAVIAFAAARGLVLRKLTTAGRTGGCNEYVFERVSASAA